MPALEKIIVSNFRNIAFQELFFSPNVNCISGNNGEGKTNLLDAVWYLSMTKSPLSSSDRFNFRHGEEEFSISGTYRMQNGLGSRFAVQVTAGGEKKLLRDDKPYQKISDHIGVLPIVMVSPSDTSLVSESAEERRRFVNSVLSQMDREYLSAVQQYNRLLVQRNRVLKGFAVDRDLLSVLDAKMQRHAEYIYNVRRRFAEDISPIVARYYGEVSGGREEVSVSYESDLDRAPLDTLLAESYEKDMALRHTTAGVHRDDFVFSMSGYPIRRCGSQGQQKSFLVSLKFAQYDLMKKAYGFAPTLLLDDVFDKLDMKRIANLLTMVAGSDFGQIFITDSNKVRMASLVDRLTDDRAYFECVAGTFTRQ